MSLPMSTFRLACMLSLSLCGYLAAGCNSAMIGGTELNSDGGSDAGGDSTPPQIPGCTGSCVVNYSCPVAMGPTTITGTVNIPAGNLPINNAQVYIPVGATMPGPPKPPVSCDSCVSQPSPFSTTTDVNGRFVLKDVPSGQNIPLIVQVGKWRRTITIPSIADCTTTQLAANETRLPRNQSEGYIPKIALTTGALDAMECLLRSNKLGLDDSEFTVPSGSGRVNLYAGVTGSDRYANGTTFPAANPWWDSAANWQKYDIVMLSCEGYPSSHDLSKKSVAARQAMQTYLNLGGRVFASHWHGVWLQNSVQQGSEPPLSVVGTFLNPANYGTNYGYSNDGTGDEGTINTAFPRGQALQTWLANNGALNTNQTIPIRGVRVSLMKNNTNVSPMAMNPNPAYGQSWIRLTKNNGTLDTNLFPAQPSQYFSFYTPLSQPPALQCGQMVWTDLHVAGGTGDASGAGATLAFPRGCTSSGLSAQEKALIFLLFDLTSCIQPQSG